MKRQLVILLAVFCGVHLFAQGQSSDINVRQFYPINTGHSYLEFSVTYMGYAKVKGRFADFDGMIRYDENDLSKTSVSLNIKTESINTDHEWRDKDLKSDAWFDVEKYPFISFQSKKIIPKTQGFDIIGDLTIKEVTNEVVVAMNPPSGVLLDTRGDSQVIFTGNLIIDRTKYGVEGERWSKIKEGITAVDSKVAIEISILGKRISEKNLSGWFRNEEKGHGRIYKVLKDSGIKASLEEFNRLREAGERIKPNTLKLVGQMLLLTESYQDALTIFKENATAFPDNSDVHHNLGVAYVENGNIKKAVTSFEKALELYPQNAKSKEVLRHLK